MNERSREVALLLLRLSGLMLAWGHGWGKVTALAAGEADRLIGTVAGIGFPAPALFAWAAGLSELVGGGLVFLGLGARLGAAFAAFTMFVAAFFRHHAFEQLLVTLGLKQVSAKTLESWGDPERALLFLLALLGVTLLGAGRYSLGRALAGRSRSAKKRA